MDLHFEMMLQEYDDNLPSFIKTEEIIRNELNKIVNNLGFEISGFKTRIKTKKSLAGKLELKGHKYKSLADITDIIGVRVITFYTDDVDKIAAAVEKTFIVDRENSIDKRSLFNVDQFGYMSLHYVCTIPESLYKDEKYPFINKIKFEIQMRTTLQHAWASVYHDTGYKNDIEVPAEFLRRLNRIASLLELADSEFMDIKVKLDEYRRNVKQIVASGNFNDIELTSDSFVAYVENGGFDALNNKIAHINNIELQPVNYMSYLVLFKRLELKTLGDIEKYKKLYSNDAYRFAVQLFNGTDIDIVASSIGMYCLCVVSFLRMGYGEGGLVLLLNYLYGERNINIRQAKKAYNIGLEMGIVPEGNNEDEK